MAQHNANNKNKNKNKNKNMNKKAEFIRHRNNRIKFVGVIFCLCLTALFVRIGYIKYVKGAEYERLAVKQQVTGKNNIEKETNPNRGYILDRNKQPLAVSSRVYTVVLDIIMLDARKTDPDPNKDPKTVTLTKLSEALSIPLRDLEALFAKDGEGNLKNATYYYIVARQVPSAVALPLEELSDVYLEADTQRTYTDPTLAPQVIGFLRGDSSWGLENQYNEELVGQQGRTFRTYDRENNPVTEDIPPSDGYTLITTLDAGIQRIAQAAVEKAYNTIECQATSLLVMNPYTGEILAMAQWPSFSLADPSNPALFTNKNITSLWDALSAEEQLNQLYKVWGNYNITHSFEPGSIFKPMVVAAAIEENIIDPATFSTFCGGTPIKIYDREIPCWSRYGHGGQDVVEVLAHSCNLGMIDIINRMGRDLFYKYRCDFGFGEKTDIDLPGEASVSSTVVMYPLSQLNPVELATSAMGQGFNNTAIQAVTAFSAVINGGNVMKPYIVSQIVDNQYNVVKENTPTLVRKAISGETSDFMRYALQQVMEPGGTGAGARIEGYAIGGKTGSGQQGADRDQMTLSFISFFPAENPAYVILAVIDRTADIELTSSATVSPMMREVIAEIIQYKNIPPSDGTTDINTVRSSINDNTVLSDYSGMQLVEVTRHLNNLNIDYQVSGSGTVVSSHIPAAGQPVPTNSPIFLYLDPESQYEGEMAVVPNVEGLPMEQAEMYVAEANFTPITFLPETATEEASGGDPVTYYPTYSGGGDSSGDGGNGSSGSSGSNGENSESASTAAGSFTSPYYVYKQYPLPGSYIQKGTEVKLKVKANN